MSAIFLVAIRFARGYIVFRVALLAPAAIGHKPHVRVHPLVLRAHARQGDGLWPPRDGAEDLHLPYARNGYGCGPTELGREGRAGRPCATEFCLQHGLSSRHVQWLPLHIQGRVAKIHDTSCEPKNEAGSLSGDALSTVERLRERRPHVCVSANTEQWRKTGLT